MTDQFAGARKMVLSAILLLCAGCYHPEPTPGPDDKKPDNLPAVTRAADEGMNRYRTAAADACAAMRAKAGAFKSWDELNKAWEEANRAARVEAFGAYAEAINAELFKRGPDGAWKTDGPIDAAELDRVLTEAERGFRGK